MFPTTPLSVSVVAILTLLVIVGALWVVTLRNLFRAALSLGIVLVGVAGFFLLLEAEFLAFVHILVYVGAILIIVVFAIMLTGKLNLPAEESSHRNVIPAALISLGLFFLLARIIFSVQWPLAPAGDPVPLATLGQQLITTLILPFEVISLVFIATLVGAIALISRNSTDNN